MQAGRRCARPPSFRSPGRQAEASHGVSMTRSREAATCATVARSYFITVLVEPYRVALAVEQPDAANQVPTRCPLHVQRAEWRTAPAPQRDGHLSVPQLAEVVEEVDPRAFQALVVVAVEHKGPVEVVVVIRADEAPSIDDPCALPHRRQRISAVVEGEQRAGHL